MSVLPESLRAGAHGDGVEKLVVGAVVHHGGAVLVVTRSELDEFLPGIDELPSGGVEVGESLTAALDRELLEEVGFESEVIDGDFLEHFDYRSASGRLTRQLTVSVPLADRIVKLSDEHVAARWVTAGDVVGTTCTPETKGVIEAWFLR
ncbi:NUDIX domain-containing protein [Brevibacterium linens]|uniref:NUDIX domain-containing protein n=1 Tax=Brevibacterium linens TaxID=1703 RepID=UPI003F898750